jgi:hypothetical protein
MSIVIFDSHQPGGWKSAYLSATAEEVPGGNLDRGIEIFSAGSLVQGMRKWTRDDVRSPAPHLSTAPPRPSTSCSRHRTSEYQ